MVFSGLLCFTFVSSPGVSTRLILPWRPACANMARLAARKMALSRCSPAIALECVPPFRTTFEVDTTVCCSFYYAGGM